MSPAAKLTSGFFLATAVASALVGIVAVWMGDVDPKFRDSPQAAMQSEFILGGIVTVVATGLVGIAAAFAGKNLAAGHTAMLVAIAWGVTYPVLWRFCIARIVETWDAHSLTGSALGWVYFLGFPLLLYLPLWKLRTQRKSNDQASVL